MFSKPEKDIAVQSEWRNFVDKGQLKSSDIRQIINDSWIRSQHAGVSINALDAPIVLQSHALEEYLFNHQQLLESSLPILKQYQPLLDYHDLLLIISDEKGVILHTVGDPKIHNQAESLHLISGANWSERTFGTNAIGTAIEMGTAVQVHANEHYCSTVKRWTCTANVIRHPSTKEILGVLDVSGLKASYNQQTLALVMSLASQIEHQLYIQEIENKNILLDRFVSFQKFNTCAAILFDHHGYAIQANAFMKDLLLKNDRFNQIRTQTHFNQLTIHHLKSFFSYHENLNDELHVEDISYQNNMIGHIVYYASQYSAAQKNQAKITTTNTDPNIIGQSSILIHTLNKTKQLARTHIPVLLHGETGVGKELFAKYIHQNSTCHQHPFVVINCGSFSKELISAELFGYVDGAFTGARKGGMKGKIEEADGGTLFLDEIGELPLDLQSHLLRALENGEIYRLGDNKPRQVNFRLICATNRNLKEEVASKNFRLDLLHRIAVSQINIPSLKERQNDIDLLIDHYLELLRKKHQLPYIQITQIARDILKQYSWPGNIRELRNVLEVMMVTCSQNAIMHTDIPEDILKSRNNNTALSGQSLKNNAQNLQDIEYASIRQTLVDVHGNITKAAKILGLAKSTLYVKIKKYNLNDIIFQSREN